jgi:hypothetical protein
MNGKQLLVVMLSVVILLTLAFAPISTEQSGSYDPWLDYNDDGVIDVNDLSALAYAYGYSGDTTKNVNVTNWPVDADGNLMVGIKDPIAKYGVKTQTYVTNWPSTQNVSITNWLPRYKTPLVIAQNVTFPVGWNVTEVYSNWTSLDGYSSAYLFIHVKYVEGGWGDVLEHVNVTWSYRIEDLEAKSKQIINLPVEPFYGFPNSTASISPAIGNDIQFKFILKRFIDWWLQVYYIEAYLYLSE